MKQSAIGILAAMALAACGGNESNTGMESKRFASAGTKAAVAATSAQVYANAVQQLYLAYFGRAADPGGLANFEAALMTAAAPTDIQGLLDAYGGNASIKTLVDGFGTSAESTARYGNAGTPSFVDAVFLHLLGRQPASTGLAFWVTAIDSGQITKGEAALSIAAGALANHTAQGELDARLINARLGVANDFTDMVATLNAGNAYSGAGASTIVSNMIASVNADTTVAGFHQTVIATVQELMNQSGSAGGSSSGSAGGTSGSSSGSPTGGSSGTGSPTPGSSITSSIDAAANYLDRVDFGNAASESAHGFELGISGTPAGGTGLQGQTYRQPVTISGTTPADGTQQLTFTMAVDPAKQNYLTVKLSGDDIQQQELFLAGTENVFNTKYPSLPVAIDNSTLDNNPPFPGRFRYDTFPIPLQTSLGKTSVSLTLYENNSTSAGSAGLPVYSAFVHTVPYFVPSPNDATGSAPPLTSAAPTYTALTATDAFNLKKALRTSLYVGTGGNASYFDAVRARQIPANTAGAPREVWGLDLGTAVSQWTAAHPGATADQWRNAVATVSRQPGYSTVPSELLSDLTFAFLVPPLADANGNVASGLDHQHDPGILAAIVAALDGTAYIQNAKGGFNMEGYWEGLTSSPRGSGSGAGQSGRLGGSLPSLEGDDSFNIGLDIVTLLNDSYAAPLFQTYLAQSYDADLNGGSTMRAYAYERMLYNHIQFFVNGQLGGTPVQNAFEVSGLYTAQIALEKLQSLYPNASYPALSPEAGLGYVEQTVGLAPSTLLNAHTVSGVANYDLSAHGFGEADGTNSSGFDGGYGQYLPHMTARFAYFVTLDPGLAAAAYQPRIAAIAARARAAIQSFDEFIGPGIQTNTWNGTLVSRLFNYCQEDVISYRKPFNPNSRCNEFNADIQYNASAPNSAAFSPYALRSAYLGTQFGVTPTPLEWAWMPAYRLHFMTDLANYEATIDSLVGIAPSSLTPLPGEIGQPDYVWADISSGALAVVHNQNRLYVSLNWRRPDGGADNWMRVHHITPSIDRSAFVYLPFDGTTVQSDGNISSSANSGAWIGRYGAYLIAMNRGASSIDVALPSGSGYAQELKTGKMTPMGSKAAVVSGDFAVFLLP